MSTTTLEKTAVGADDASDLASLVVAYHRVNHTGEPSECEYKLCTVADQCLTLDAMFYGA